MNCDFDLITCYILITITNANSWASSKRVSKLFECSRELHPEGKPIRFHPRNPRTRIQAII